jgi:hypothetical protein
MTIFRFVPEQREERRFNSRATAVKYSDLPLHQPTVWELLPHSTIIRPHRPVVGWVQSQGMACRVVAAHESVKWQQFPDLDALCQLEVAA